MPTKSFVTPGLAAPGQQDMTSLAEEQARLQAALMGQQKGLAPQPTSAGAFQALNFEGLANALAARESQTALANNQKKQADVRGAYQQGLAESLRKLDTAGQGGQVALPGPTESGEPLTGAVPGDQRAWAKFLNSPYPEVRAAAERQKAEYDKRGEKLLDRASLESVQQAGGDWGQYKVKPEDKVVDGTLVRVAEGEKPTLAPGAGYTQKMLDSGAVVNQNTLTGKQTAADGSPKLSVVNKSGDKILDDRIKKISDSQEMAMKRGDTLRSTEQALASLRDGATTGFGSEWVQNLRTAASMLTGKDFEANTPTAVLQKALAENVVNEFGGKLGSGISASDVTLMGKATGDANTDGKAIERILAIRAAAALRAIDEHNRLVGVVGPYADKSLGQGQTGLMYRVERPRFELAFQTPEAQAAFEAGITGRPYAEVLREMKPVGAGSTKVDVNSPENKAKLKAMGIQ